MVLCYDMVKVLSKKKEMEYSLNNLSNDANFVIYGLCGIKTRKIIQKDLAKVLNCTQVVLLKNIIKY